MLFKIQDVQQVPVAESYDGLMVSVELFVERQG